MDEKYPNEARKEQNTTKYPESTPVQQQSF